LSERVDDVKAIARRELAAIREESRGRRSEEDIYIGVTDRVRDKLPDGAPELHWRTVRRWDHMGELLH
jgi:hypothetical protein